MKKRFSKASVVATLSAISESYQMVHKFDPKNGTAQLRKYKVLLTDDNFTNKCVDYGKWVMLNALIRDIEESNLLVKNFIAL